MKPRWKEKTIKKEEVWKPVVYCDFMDYYDVSNYGRVKSKAREVWHNGHGGHYMQLKERILRPYVSDNKRGYPSVILNRDGNTYNIAIHILVYTSFVGEIPEGMTINHKDGNKKDPHVDNLELMTYGENIKHAVDILQVNTRKPRYEYFIKNLETNDVLEFQTAVDAGKYFNVTDVTIKQYAIGHFKGVFKDTYEIIRNEIIT